MATIKQFKNILLIRILKSHELWSYYPQTSAETTEKFTTNHKWASFREISPDEILYHYPSITLSDVYAALAYHHDHREEIRQQILESENLIQEMQAQTPSILQQKLKKLFYPGKSNLSFSDYHKTIY